MNSRLQKHGEQEISINSFTRLVAYMLVLSLPLINMTFTSYEISVTQFFGNLFAAIVLPQMLFKFLAGKLKSFGMDFWLYMVFFLIAIANDVFRGTGSYSTVKIAILFIVLYYATKDRQLWKGVGYYLVGISLLSSLTVFFNIPFLVSEGDQGRLGVIGQSINAIAEAGAGLVLIIIYLLSKPDNRSVFFKIFISFVALAVLVAIAKSGSRGACVVLIAGSLVMFAMNYRQTSWIRIAFFLTLLLGVVYFSTSETNLLIKRWTLVTENQDTGFRKELFIASTDLIKQNIFIGYGMQSYKLLGQGFGWDEINTHNTLTQLLINYGLIGFFPYIIGMVITFRNAYRNRFHTAGNIVLIGLITYFIAAQFGGYMMNKRMWIVLALAANAGVMAPVRLPFRSRKTSAEQPIEPAFNPLRPEAGLPV